VLWRAQVTGAAGTESSAAAAARVEQADWQQGDSVLVHAAACRSLGQQHRPSACPRQSWPVSQRQAAPCARAEFASARSSNRTRTVRRCRRLLTPLPDSPTLRRACGSDRCARLSKLSSPRRSAEQRSSIQGMLALNETERSAENALTGFGPGEWERAAFREGNRSASVTPIHTNLARCALFTLGIGWGPAQLLHARAHVRAARACQWVSRQGGVALRPSAEGEGHDRCPLCVLASNALTRAQPADNPFGLPELWQALVPAPPWALTAPPVASPSARAPPSSRTIALMPWVHG
jgi:hypothetical protein